VKSLRKLVIVSHVCHYRFKGELFAYGPYAREIAIWAELFPEVVIAAPLHQERPPGDATPLAQGNITVQPQLETGGGSLLLKALQLFALPVHIWRLGNAMRRADAIQVRCPGNLGLFGCLLAPLFGKPRVAKYAGQWSDYQGEPMSCRWQKALLRSRWWRAPVLVYGKWPDQPSHIVPFFTSIMDEAQMDRARTAELRDWTKRPLEVLFVGRLSEAKNVDVIIRAIAAMQNEARWVRLRVVGDGPMRATLESLANSLKVADRVMFQGAVPQAKVLDFYEQAHVLVLASQTEGWPKAIAEAMAFGLVCIGTDRGFVPQMLGDGRGLLVPPRDIVALADALRSVLSDPGRAEQISERAAAWAQQFTLERFRDALRAQLESAWKVTLRPVSRPGALAPGLAPNPVLHD
jgi:glycosyltransferase involved in cell wall biosynthesis